MCKSRQARAHKKTHIIAASKTAAHRYYQDAQQAEDANGEEEEAEPERAKQLDPDELLKQAEEDANIDQVRLAFFYITLFPLSMRHAKRFEHDKLLK